MEALTIAEVAERTGLSKAALARRIERGTLRAVKRNGLRRIPVSELERAGLAATDSTTLSHVAPRGSHDVAAVITSLTERLEAQAYELGRLRALTVEAESLRSDRERLEAQLFEAHARVMELEAKARQRRFGWLRSRQLGAVT